MLEITADAEFAIRVIRQTSDLPESTALRIAPVPGPDGEVSIAFAFTQGPDEGDIAISEKDDFRVYLARELVGPFENAALEATADEEGITLELRTEAELHDNGSRLGSQHGQG